MPGSLSWLTARRATYAVICITLVMAGVRALYQGSMLARQGRAQSGVPYTGDTAPLLAVARAILTVESTTVTSPPSSPELRNAQQDAERLLAPGYRGTFQGILDWCRRLEASGELATFNTVLRLERSSMIDARTVSVTASELTSFTSAGGPDTRYAEDHRFTFVRRASGWLLAGDVVLSCGTLLDGFSGQQCGS
jgi:hypothetical protein